MNQTYPNYRGSFWRLGIIFYLIVLLLFVFATCHSIASDALLLWCTTHSYNFVVYNWLSQCKNVQRNYCPPGTRSVVTYKGCGEETSKKLYCSLCRVLSTPSQYLYHPRSRVVRGSPISTDTHYPQHSNWVGQAILSGSLMMETKHLELKHFYSVL